MNTTAKRKRLEERIRNHGESLSRIFPDAQHGPVELCKKLRRLERQGAAVALRLCNGPEYAEGENDKLTDAILAKVNQLLGNVHVYQPKTGAKCGCRRGVERDNCPAYEGTGNVIDFKKIRSCKLVPVFVNRDPRGYALKIDDEYVRTHGLVIQTDFGGYGIIAPDLKEGI